MSWLARMREGLRGLLFAGREDAEMDEEMRFHLEMETERLMRERGLDRPEARRRAAVAFGGVEKHREAVRDARGLGWVSGMSLDFRLGARMLVKYPGLALVGGLGMAVAIAIGACSFAVLYSLMLPTLPLDEGERVVGIENWNTAVNNNERVSVHDFATWREGLKSVEDLGAFRSFSRNLTTPGGQPEPVTIAEMTASGFRVARVPPLLGRPLVEEDERPGAPQVVVIGYDVWRNRFQSDPAVVGRELRLGTEVHTVVGVMPEGFAFPVSFRLWTPLQVDPSRFERGKGPRLTVFGRLAPGATLEGAQAELTAVGRRTAAAFPQTHAQIRPRMLPYTSMFMDGTEPWALHVVQSMVSLLLVVVAVNVAILVYARTATRQGEIAVRSALGASRRRIVAQLFAEALVLSGVAAAVGLAITWLVLRQVEGFVSQVAGDLPFWMEFGISPGTILYVVGLAVLGALIVGVVPALQATGRLQSRLRQLGGGTGMQMGRTWTVLIVAQVAFAVAALPAAVYMGWEWIRYGMAEPGLAAEEYLSARLAMDPAAPAGTDTAAQRREFAARYADRLDEVVRRLEAEPGVSEVTFSSYAPGQEPTVWVEVEGLETPTEVPSGHGVVAGTAGHEVRYNRVGLDFFRVFDAPVLAGRGFQAGDVDATAPAVVVNRSFVQGLLGDGRVLGRRIRYVGRGGDAIPDQVELGRWYEIVGVVGDFPNAMSPDLTQAKLYHAIAPAQAHPATLALHTQGTPPAALAGRLREITVALDPTLRLGAPRPLDQLLGEEQSALRMGALAIAIVTLCVLMLSAAGIYALMSFTVAQRRREIGIRAALGADPARILRSVFSRAVGQLALGLAVGIALAALLELASGGELIDGKGAVILPVVAGLMALVGLLAVIGPARRGLRIQPNEALKAES